MRTFPTPVGSTKCSCPDFTFTCEVALTRYNSSSVKLSNGALPRKRNVAMVPRLCKHLVHAMRVALQQTDDLAAEKIEVAAAAKSQGAAAQQRAGMEAKRKQKIPKGQFTGPPGGGMIRIP